LHWGDFGTCVQEKANRFDVSAAYGGKQGSKPTFSSTVHVRASVN
jgi:hypothetical protein